MAGSAAMYTDKKIMMNKPLTTSSVDERNGKR